jgi:hypothetical protein
MPSYTLSAIQSDIRGLIAKVSELSTLSSSLMDKIAEKDIEIEGLKKVSRALVTGLYQPLCQDENKHILHLLHMGGLMKNYEKCEYERRGIAADPDVIKEAESYWRFFSTRQSVLLEHNFDQLKATVQQHYEETTNSRIEISKKLVKLNRMDLDEKIRCLSQKVDSIEKKEDELRAQMELFDDATNVISTVICDDVNDDIIINDSYSDSDTESDSDDDNVVENVINKPEPENQKPLVTDINSTIAWYFSTFAWYFTFIYFVSLVLLCIYIYFR